MIGPLATGRNSLRYIWTFADIRGYSAPFLGWAAQLRALLNAAVPHLSLCAVSTKDRLEFCAKCLLLFSPKCGILMSSKEMEDLPYVYVQN